MSYFALARYADPVAQLPVWQKVLALYQKLLERKPNDGERIRNVVLAHRYLSGYFQQKDLNRSLDHAQKALELSKGLLAATPANRERKLDLSFDLLQLAILHREMNRPADALLAYKRVLAMREELAAADPKDARLQARVAYTHLALGGTYRELRNYRSARAHLEDVTRLATPLLKTDPKQGLLLGYMAESQAGIAWMHEAEGNRKAACAALAVALRLHTKARELKSAYSVALLTEAQQQVGACR